MNDAPVGFRPLDHAHLPRLREWLNAPHVYEWWGAGSGEGALGGEGSAAATLEQVEAEYAPDIDADGPTHRFVIEAADMPIGMIQWYRLDDHLDYARQIGLEEGAGIDVLLGVPELVDRGIGSRVIRAFALDVVFASSDVSCCVAGPAITNGRSIRAFEKAGFGFVRDVPVDGETVPEHLMVLRRDQVAS